MHRINEKIFLGSSSDALHRAPLVSQQGITALLNVAKDLTNLNVTHQHFRITHVGLGDGDGNPKGLLYAAVMALAGLIQEGHTVLVHCHEGRSRSPTVVATYLVAKGEFQSIEEALEFLHSCRPIVNPELGVIQDFKSLDLETIRKGL